MIVRSLRILVLLNLFIVGSYSEQYDHITITVDNNLISGVCTNQQTNQSIDADDVIFNCNSFGSTMTLLNGINNVQSVEILFSSGVHVLNQTVRLATTNITLKSATNDQPNIICSDELQFMLQQSAIETLEAVPVFEIVNAKLVEIYNIHFEGCSGSVSIQNVSNLVINNSLFR